MEQSRENKDRIFYDPSKIEISGSGGPIAEQTGGECQEPEHFRNAYAKASQARVSGKRPLLLNQDKPDGSGQSAGIADFGKVTPAVSVAAPNPSQMVDTPSRPIKPKHAAPDNQKKEAETTAASPLMTIRELAVYLHVSVSTIQRLRKSDPDFPTPVQNGSSNFWFRTEVGAYLECLKARRPSGR